MKKCSRKNNDSTSLVTFDVKSSHTSIPHNYSLEAISLWIETYPHSLYLRFSKGFVLSSIKITLENNSSTCDEFYRQISGTAMATIFAPTHATSTTEYCGVHFYNICELKWGK